jgi:hypothetical protein
LVNGGVANGGAKVTTANIVASNGLIHVVDGVILLPTIVNHIKANPNLSLLGVVTSASGFSFSYTYWCYCCCLHSLRSRQRCIYSCDCNRWILSR